MQALVVDDAKTSRILNEAFLKKLGFTGIDTACDGQEGLASLDRQHFDLVVSDWEMPNMDGLEFLKAARDQGHTMPFVVISGNAVPEDVLTANAPASFLNKPGSVLELKTTLNSLFF